MRKRSTLPTLLAVIVACSDVSDTTAPSPRAALSPSTPAFASSAVTRTTAPFIARATCAADIGFDIWFGGTRELREHASSTSRSQSFVTKDFQGWLTAVTTSTYQSVAPSFDVLGGAEMFNWKPDENGVLRVRIHEGTLVFAALDGSYKVVARHVIRNVPGQTTTISQWNCRIVG
ncbi:MAG TPA: hypothetical protein VFS59_04365 [Gemmatimonadaceae bacterium]|nr:hypothetical protein [Gemmatimonadaceae bacterium]